MQKLLYSTGEIDSFDPWNLYAERRRAFRQIYIFCWRSAKLW